MNGYNVVRSSGGDGPPNALPEVLDALLDGEVDPSDPRVAAALRADPAVARRFRETQRVADRLARRPLTPDMSVSILAAVHSKKPFSPLSTRPRSRFAPARIAFAGGLLAGVALVVVLQSIAPPPHSSIEGISHESTLVARSDGVRDLGPATSTDTARVAAKPLAPAHHALDMGKPARYEAIIATGPAASGIAVAGLAGDFGLTGQSRDELQLAGSTLTDACTPQTSGGAYGVAAAAQPMPLRSMPLVPIQPINAYEPGAEWPPADINAFIDHISECGVSDDLRTAIATR